MTEKPEASVLTARRAAQHFRLSSADDAYEHLYILIVRSSLATFRRKNGDSRAIFSAGINRPVSIFAPECFLFLRAHRTTFTLTAARDEYRSESDCRRSRRVPPSAPFPANHDSGNDSIRDGVSAR